jgi:hypothetical protein
VGILREVGDFIIGKTRIGTDYNLLSQHESGKIWQLVNPAPDKCLRGWKGTGYEDKRFSFLRDYKRYGDNLLHCPNRSFKYCSEQCVSPEDILGRIKTYSMHWDMGHPAQALERTATQLDRSE